MAPGEACLTKYGVICDKKKTACFIGQETVGV